MISVVYAVYNEEAVLARSLASVHDWADEIVIVDGESTDQTVKIARQFGAKVIKTTNKPNFHINKQMAIEAASGDLILQLDADEVVDGQLRAFVQQVDRERPEQYAAWQIRRRNLFFKRWLTKGGQYPDMVIRLFYAGRAFLPQKDVHEQMTVRGRVGTAAGHLLHFANPSLSAYWRKFNTYTDFKAQQLADQQVPINKVNWFKYTLVKPFTTFVSLYIRHRGYADGAAGFLFATYSGWHHAVSFAKYVENKRPLPDGKIKVFYPGNELEKKAARGVGRATGWLVDAMADNPSVTIETKRTRAEVIHYPFFDLYRPSLKKVKKGQKLVVTVHDLIPLLFPKDYPVGLRGRLRLFGQKWRLRRADAIVADSQSTKDDLVAKFKIRPERISVVPLAANPLLKPAPAEVIQRVKKSFLLNKDYILYVGDINFNKNLAQLIKMVKFLPPEISLVLVGKNFVPQDIPEWITLQEQLDLSGVKNRVKFLSTVTGNEELAALYSGALAYVQPSSYEGFGLPILEAMRCRTVVICHRNSSLPEVGGEHVFYAESLRGEDFAAAVDKVRQLTPGQRQHWLDQAERWEQTFTWARTAQLLVEVYEKVVATS